MKRFNSGRLIIVAVIAVIATLGAAWYFLWYMPHTPVYTLQIIRQAIQNKDPDIVFQHVDTKSIVKNIVDREGNRYVDTASPLGKGLVAMTKTFAPGVIENVARQYIMDPDSFKSQDENTDNANPNTASGAQDDNISIIDRIQQGQLFKTHDIEIKNLQSVEQNGEATITVTVQNNKTHLTKDIRLMARQLGDGTWVIYDIPDIEDLYQVTRK